MSETNSKLNDLGQEIFDIIMAIESVAFLADEKKVTEEFGTYAQETNLERTYTTDTIRLRQGVFTIEIVSAQGLPDDWTDGLEIEVKIDAARVLKGRILKVPEDERESLYTGFAPELFVDGTWVDEVREVAQLYRDKLAQASEVYRQERDRVSAERLKRKLEERKNK